MDIVTALNTIKTIDHFAQHLPDCESEMFEICTCGLAKIRENCREAMKSIRAVLAASTPSREWKFPLEYDSLPDGYYYEMIGEQWSAHIVPKEQYKHRTTDVCRVTGLFGPVPTPPLF